MKKCTATFMLFLLVAISCTEEKLISTSESSVPAVVDLQWGFEEHEVSIYFNQKLSFQASLSASVPLAGPMASFTTSLLRDSNNIKIGWRSHIPNSIFHQDSALFLLENASEYYLGLELRDDSLIFKVQDTPFIYAISNIMNGE